MADIERAYRRIAQGRKNTLARHGIDHKDYQALYKSQGGKCAVCRKEGPPIRFLRPVTNLPDPTHPLIVDHCHQRGVVRGLLCGACNQAEGLLCSDIETIENLLVYVQFFLDGGFNKVLEERGVTQPPPHRDPDLGGDPTGKSDRLGKKRKKKQDDEDEGENDEG